MVGALSSKHYVFDDGLVISFSAIGFLNSNKTPNYFIYSYLENKSHNDVWVDRNSFFIKSLQGIEFISIPYKTIGEHPNGLFAKQITFPEKFSLKKGEKLQYVFDFISKQSFSNKQFDALLKRDTICFLSTGKNKIDTLFKTVVDDRRLK